MPKNDESDIPISENLRPQVADQAATERTNFFAKLRKLSPKRALQALRSGAKRSADIDVSQVSQQDEAVSLSSQVGNTEAQSPSSITPEAQQPAAEQAEAGAKQDTEQNNAARERNLNAFNEITGRTQGASELPAEDAADTEPEYTGKYAKEYAKAAAAARERTGGTLRVTGGDFMNVDGTLFVRADEADRYDETLKNKGWSDSTRQMENGVLPHDGLNFPLDSAQGHRDTLVGHYGYNNGLIQYVDASGLMHAGYGTKENMQALKDAGYEFTSDFPVSLSNAEIRFVNPKAKKRDIDPEYYYQTRGTEEEVGKATEKLNQDYQEMLERGRQKAAEERKAAEEKRAAAKTETAT